jgi:hypothetical protein
MSANTSNTYLLNTSAVPFSNASQSCRDNGGELVYYSSLAEQLEVEAYFTALGIFLPSYHRTYWIGLQSNGYSGKRRLAAYSLTDHLVVPGPCGPIGDCMRCRQGICSKGMPPAHCSAAFEWVSPSYKSKNYSHWGIEAAFDLAEPNNLKKEEYCTVANSSQMAADGAFGWSDEWCNTTSAFLCKVQSECLGHAGHSSRYPAPCSRCQARC